MKTLLCSVLFFFATCFSVPAQDALSGQEQEAVIDSLCQHLLHHYVFPETAKAMADHLHSQQVKGTFLTFTQPDAFSAALTEQLQLISRDKHLRVKYAPQMAKELIQMRSEPEDRREIPKEWLRDMQRDNFGFKEIKIMPGNIGYLDLRGFNPASIAGQTASAAMNFLSNSDALIIDLRQNGGGDPGMIQLITSYLYDEHSEPIHLNSFYFRPENITTQTWTLPFVSGQRLGADKPVYVLTSSHTFSAAEEFTYNLKNLKRAVIVGETTGGGAHPGGHVPIGQSFVAFVPTGRAINPITNTNWEGVGVSPDILISKEEAFDKAYYLALDTLSKRVTDDQERAYYQWQKTGLEAAAHPPALSIKDLEKYTGTFGERHFFLENGQLCYQREGGKKHVLVAMGGSLFRPVSMMDFRLKFEWKNDEVVSVIGLYEDGHSDRNDRTSTP